MAKCANSSQPDDGADNYVHTVINRAAQDVLGYDPYQPAEDDLHSTAVPHSLPARAMKRLRVGLSDTVKSVIRINDKVQKACRRTAESNVDQ